jgi:hypothetical protein
MNSLRSALPRTATALLAVAVLAWCALHALPLETTAAPTTPSAKEALLLGGATAAPVAVPLVVLLFNAARD